MEINGNLYIENHNLGNIEILEGYDETKRSMIKFRCLVDFPRGLHSSLDTRIRTLQCLQKHQKQIKMNY